MKRALLPLLAFFLALPVRAQTLTGFARLPASTFVSGPTSGQTIEVKDRLVPIPFVNKQPIQGFSALWRVGDSEFLALEDNGFGAKKNSADFLLRMVRVRLDFKAAQGGTGAANVISSFVFTDPNRRVPFPLVRDDRQLTGADFDPESFVVARDGVSVARVEGIAAPRTRRNRFLFPTCRAHQPAESGARCGVGVRAQSRRARSSLPSRRRQKRLARRVSLAN